jgi:hypothetical protein
MRIRILSLCFILLSTLLAAQNSVVVNLVIAPPYSPYLSEYTEFGGQNVLQLTNTTAASLQVKLVGSITGLDNGLNVQTKPEYQPPLPIVMAPGQTVTVNASTPSRDFLDPSNTNTNVSQEQQNAISTSGVLPEGNYQICVRAADYQTGEFLSPDGSGCVVLPIAYPVPPIPINPSCGTIIQNPLPAFSWTPVYAQGAFFLYDVYLLKLVEGQIPDDAMWLAISGNVGNPVVIRNLPSGVYQYKPYDIPLQSGATYAWCVVARDATGQFLIANQGRSEVCTFTYQPITPPSGTSSETAETSQPVLPVEFNLNNTSVSGTLLYRYHNNEVMPNPNSALYNPSKTVGGVALTASELQALPNTTTGTGGGATSGSPGQMGGNVALNLNGSAGLNGFTYNQLAALQNQSQTAMSGKIQIDPAVKYLYHNTLSNNGSEPLRETSVSLYLEYVAVEAVQEGNTAYFRVMQGGDLYYNKTSHTIHGAPLDPQLAYADQQNGGDGMNGMDLRPLGSELLATTTTDASGNFQFDFDMLENTGLLSKQVTLVTQRFNKPDEEKAENQWVNPLDMVSNPMQEITTPTEQNTQPGGGVMLGGLQTMYGNAQLQGNAGWGASSPGLNALQNTMQNLGGQAAPGLNQQIQGGPESPNLLMPEGDLITYIPVQVKNLYKVLRIKVNNPQYQCPDILVFVQPGEQLNLPPVSTFVNSFNAEMKVLSGGKLIEADQLYYPPKTPLGNFKIKTGRLRSFWEGKPDNFPLHEGMDLLPEQYFSIASASSHYLGFSNSNKPAELKLTSEGMTGTNGTFTFKRLVCNKYNATGDMHYFEVVMPLTGNQHFAGTWGSMGMAAKLPDHMSKAIHSFNFTPTTVQVEVQLEPLAPEILLRTVTKSNIEIIPVAGADVILNEFRSEANMLNFHDTRVLQTDENGYARFTNLSILTGLQGVNNPYRKLLISKYGYPLTYLPINDPFAYTSPEKFIQPLKKGQRMDLGEIMLEGKTEVFGYVRDEENQPVMALIKIGEGPYVMTEMSSQETGYNNPLRRTVPPLPVSYPVNVPAPSALFGLIDNGALQGAGNLPALPGFPSGNTSAPSSGATQGAGLNYLGAQWQTSPALDQFLTLHSRFEQSAAITGSNTRVIVIPMSDAYMPDTFQVNIPMSGGPINIGTFMVFEKAHRVKVVVKRQGGSLPLQNGMPVPGQVNLPSANAYVEIGDYAQTTGSDGVVYFKFNTPDSYFRVFVKDANRVPVEEYKYLPISKAYIELEYFTEAGMTVSGVVRDAANNQPVNGARVYFEGGSTAYGPTVTETFTNAMGQYTLSGLPRENITLKVAKHSDTETWIGASKPVTNPSATLNNFDFSMSRFTQGSLTHIYGFPIEITRLINMKDGTIKLSGAFVNVPENGNFKMLDPQQRLRFSNIILEGSPVVGNPGQTQYLPAGGQVNTQETALRVRLLQNFMADFRGMGSGIFNPIVVKPKKGNLGGMFGKVKSDLESFRFAFDYTGDFYVGENVNQAGLFPFVSQPSAYPQREFYIMDMAPFGAVVPIRFRIHEFQAGADAELSRLKKDTVKIVTRLYPQWALAGDVVVNAGTIRVSPSSIQIAEGAEPLTFSLEKWKMKSVNGWSYSIPLGGILVPKALLQTKMADIPIKNLILRPNQLIMPQENIDLNNLSLGGGVTALKQYSNVQATFNLDQACSSDLKPHYRFSLYHSNPDMPACYIQGLPGFANNAHIDIGSFTIYSNDELLIQPVYQSKSFYNVAQLNVQSITSLYDGIELAGAVDLGIPGMTISSIVLSFTKPGSTIQQKVKTFDVALETPGKVFFNGYTGVENYTFAPNFFQAKGKLIFDDDVPGDAKMIELKGILTKQNQQIQLTIPKLIENSTADNAYQMIPLNGGTSKLKVLEGKQEVLGGAWNTLSYLGDLMNEGLTTDRTLRYDVSGVMEVNKEGDNALKIDKIDTPLGGMSVVFDWGTMMLLGTLNIEVPIPISPTVTLNKGLFEICFSGKGFYFDMVGNASIPGLDAIGNINFGFLTGYYPVLPQTVLNRHQDLMYLLDVPVYLKNDGIAGLYINANIAPPIANWSKSLTIPVLPPITIGAGISAGADMNFLLNFGSSAYVMTIDAAAYAKAWAGVDILVCEFCVGALARFTANGTLQIAPQAQASLGACASLTMFGSFCGGEMDLTAGIEASMSTQNGFDISLQWEPCGGPASKEDMSCEF